MDSINNILKQIQEKYPEILNHYVEKSDYERCVMCCDGVNKSYGHLNEYDGYNCEICRNKGYIMKPREYNGFYQDVAVECSCKKIRENIMRLKKSGLMNSIERYTFEKYRITDKWQEIIFNKANEYLNSGKWFFIGGQSGCGKTHICTAICGELLKRGKSVCYMLWMNEVKRLKSTIMDTKEHERLIEKYREVDVLYIDDFFKQGQNYDGNVPYPTSAEINLAYEILNYRYINPKLMTIISSERYLGDLAKIDEAVCYRIFERCEYGKYIVKVEKKPEHNFRRKQLEDL